jgi:exosortase B
MPDQHITSPPLGGMRLASTFLAGGLLALYLPTIYDLATGLWGTDRNAHGPIVLSLAVWLFHKKGLELLRTQIVPKPNAIFGFITLITGLFAYVVGRSQSIMFMEVGSVILVLLGIVIALWGTGTAGRLWFAFFFLLFAIPMPASVTDTLTQPMKILVSIGAEFLLNTLGYPAARSGVVLYVGNYQLLVADACAGLNSLFTLEALGLLYLNVNKHASAFRNFTLALLIVPISYSSNVVRVLTLALITYHLGDDAGQGFLHGFSGMVLFMTALILIIVLDGALRAAARSLPWPKNSTA